MTFRVRQISISIDRSANEVYEFAVNPENLPKWASGLSGGIEQVDGQWVSESPMGRVVVRFAERNPFGVLDHDVTLPNGETVTNPVRVIPNGSGSQITFTLFQLEGMSEAAFEADSGTVRADLQTLKQLLERR
ncbi:MAG TPA: SRPBCC family protein [Dehalococcoidia bacterium]|nr:SRPBCC family protein [Dehalococcoidia bacterium]